MPVRDWLRRRAIRGPWRMKVDAESGAVKSLRLAGEKHEYVDSAAGVALNDYRYVLGSHSKSAQSNGPVQVQVLEGGPLVASLRIESDAPGCNRLVLRAGRD